MVERMNDSELNTAVANSRKVGETLTAPKSPTIVFGPEVKPVQPVQERPVAPTDVENLLTQSKPGVSSTREELEARARMAVGGGALNAESLMAAMTAQAQRVETVQPNINTPIKEDWQEELKKAQETGMWGPYKFSGTETNLDGTVVAVLVDTDKGKFKINLNREEGTNLVSGTFAWDVEIDRLFERGGEGKTSFNENIDAAVDQHLGANYFHRATATGGVTPRTPAQIAQGEQLRKIADARIKAAKMLLVKKEMDDQFLYKFGPFKPTKKKEDYRAAYKKLREAANNVIKEQSTLEQVPGVTEALNQLRALEKASKRRAQGGYFERKNKEKIDALAKPAVELEIKRIVGVRRYHSRMLTAAMNIANEIFIAEDYGSADFKGIPALDRFRATKKLNEGITKVVGPFIPALESAGAFFAFGGKVWKPELHGSEHYRFVYTNKIFLFFLNQFEEGFKDLRKHTDKIFSSTFNYILGGFSGGK